MGSVGVFVTVDHPLLETPSSGLWDPYLCLFPSPLFRHQFCSLRFLNINLPLNVVFSLQVLSLVNVTHPVPQVTPTSVSTRILYCSTDPQTYEVKAPSTHHVQMLPFQPHSSPKFPTGV